jgi:hypothetical protein
MSFLAHGSSYLYWVDHVIVSVIVFHLIFSAIAVCLALIF